MQLLGTGAVATRAAAMTELAFRDPMPPRQQDLDRHALDATYAESDGVLENYLRVVKKDLSNDP